jgi:hypothetical protein
VLFRPDLVISRQRFGRPQHFSEGPWENAQKTSTTRQLYFRLHQKVFNAPISTELNFELQKTRRYVYNGLRVRLILFGDLSTMKQQLSSIPVLYSTVVEKYQNFNVCTGTGAIRTDLRSVKICRSGCFYYGLFSRESNFEHLLLVGVVSSFVYTVGYRYCISCDTVHPLCTAIWTQELGSKKAWRRRNPRISTASNELFWQLLYLKLRWIAIFHDTERSEVMWCSRRYIEK